MPKVCQETPFDGCQIHQLKAPLSFCVPHTDPPPHDPLRDSWGAVAETRVAKGHQGADELFFAAHDLHDTRVCNLHAFGRNIFTGVQREALFLMANPVPLMWCAGILTPNRRSRFLLHVICMFSKHSISAKQPEESYTPYLRFPIFELLALGPS